MIFEEIKDKLPNIKKNTKKQNKESISMPTINSTSLIHDNGLSCNKLIWEGHSSYVYNGFYYHTVPAIIKVVCRETKYPEINEMQLLEILREKDHIIELYDSILKKDYSIFVFQKINALPAEQILSKELTLENLRAILKNVLIALDQAHRLDIVHRDVRLQNILVKPNFEDAYLIGWKCGTKISTRMESSIGSRSIRSVRRDTNVTYIIRDNSMT